MVTNIVFLHLDLGIGGAERLIVDAAVGLQKQSSDNKVLMFTNHHNPSHAFQETIDGTLQTPVQVHGDWIPRSIFNFLYIVFAILRFIYLSVIVGFQLNSYLKKLDKIDILVVDQISATIPLLKILPFTKKAKIVFYCHFPDKLLSQKTSILKRLYRIPFDWIEEVGTKQSDLIYVNSNFTKQIFFRSFPSITNIKPKVLYPPINCSNYDRKPDATSRVNEKLKQYIEQQCRFVVSINRFERKKAVHLAVLSFAQLLKEVNGEDLILVLAGGYDPRVRENLEYFEELSKLVKENNIEKQTLFLPNFTEADRYLLLHNCDAVIYTPENEHFGIVPVEAQYCRRVVVAVKSGGPLESIAHGVTGFLVEPNAKAFAAALTTVLNKSKSEREAMGEQGRQRVLQMFSLDSFSKQLHDDVQHLLSNK